MKKLLYILLLGSTIYACNDDEGALEPQMQFENIYTIVDDTTDAVKHHVYEIYEKYGIPVYFNDTIGKVLVKTDVNGQPFYRYETLDLAWNFDSYDQNFTYEYVYLTDPEQPEAMLDAIELYLENAAKPLWPFAFFVVDSARTIDRRTLRLTEWEEKYRLDNFRTITLLNGNWDWYWDDPAEVMDEMKRSYVVNKIAFFATEVARFGAISQPSWYDEYWNLTDKIENIIDDNGHKWDYTYGGGYFIYAVNDINLMELFNEPVGIGTLMNAAFAPHPERYTEEQWKALSEAAHYIAGSLGFVSYNSGDYSGSGQTPIDSDDDLRGYVKVMLETSDADFRDEWGSYPLVMEKYEIVYRILTEELGLEL